MLNTFLSNDNDGTRSHVFRGFSHQVGEKLVDMLLTCLAGSQLAVALYDPEDHLLFANPCFRDAYAIERGSYPTWGDMICNCYRTHTGALIETDAIDTWLTNVSTRRRKLSNRAFEVDLVDGRWLWMTESMSSDGWLLCIASDITPLKINERQLEQARDLAVHAAQTDPLTGGYNRRFIFSRLDEMLEDAQVTGTPLCVAVLDLDHFKQINDSYGHLAGDRLLQHFVTQTQLNLRPPALLGRIGGEEFLLLLPNTSLADAMQIMERLRRAIAKMVRLPEMPKVRCSFSAGVTNADLSDTVSSLFQRADQAVYVAKDRGRNQQVSISS